MRFEWSISTILVGAGAIVATALAAALVAIHTIAGAGRHNSANLTGTVQFGAGGDACQGFVIDHKTGFIRHDQRVVCREAAKDLKRDTAKESNRVPERVESRHPGGARIDAVRDSFNNR